MGNGKKINHVYEFPKGDSLTILTRGYSGSSSESSWKVEVFENQTDFKAWIKSNPTSQYIPLLCKKLEIEVDIRIKDFEKEIKIKD